MPVGLDAVAHAFRPAPVVYWTGFDVGVANGEFARLDFTDHDFGSNTFGKEIGHWTEGSVHLRQQLGGEFSIRTVDRDVISRY